MITRGVAGLFALITIFNLLARLGGSVQDSAVWWIDLRHFGSILAAAIESAAAIAFVVLCLPATKLSGGNQSQVLELLRSSGSGEAGWRHFASNVTRLLRSLTVAALLRRRLAAASTFGVLAMIALQNAVGVWSAANAGSVSLRVPVPFSILIAGLMAGFGWCVWRDDGRTVGVVQSSRLQLQPRRLHQNRFGQATQFAFGFGGAAIALPLAQMLFFGTSDYRRQADAAVVFGAGVYPDGTPSQALSDRTETACRLYQQGRVKLLIFSGGPSRGSVHETEAMRQIALQQGVPESAIRLDPKGLNTDATVRNTRAIFEREGVRQVLAVSHHYHLPRVKMAYARAGIDVFTVPAEEARPLLGLPRFVVREVAASWFYWGKGLVAGPGSPVVAGRVAGDRSALAAICPSRL